MNTLFLGTFISSESLNELKVIDGYIVVQNGKITSLGHQDDLIKFKQENDLKEYKLVQLKADQFLIPGFIDCHVHAPQFPNCGMGLDKPLLEWLKLYTFPLEKKYSDTKFAAEVYNNVVRRLLKNGTTTACYFGSLHLDASLILAKTVVTLNQRALVGKVSMNMKNDADYYNETEVELRDTETFLKGVYQLKNDLVEPIITPRFAISCDENLMTKLGALANKYGCKIQTHISENCDEVAYVNELYPERSSYADVYDKTGILTNQSILAHAVHLGVEEMQLLATRGTAVAHCPASNTRLHSGLCPVRALLTHGITVGLGTDVSGGDSTSILDSMKRSMDVSTHLEFTGNNDGYTLNWKEAFYLATLGGAKALNLDHKIGSFQVGKEFDALLISPYVEDGPIDQYAYCIESGQDVPLGLLKRFIYMGDDRNIGDVFVKGVRVNV